MATYRVYSGAAGANDGTSWTDAFTTFAAAVTAANAASDVILVHYTHTEELGADTTYTFLANVRVICVDKDTSDAPTVMGTGAWIGNSTANRSVTFAGTFIVYMYGLTVRTAGTTADSILVTPVSGSHYELESCYLWSGNTATGSRISLGAGARTYIRLSKCTFRFGSTSQLIAIGAAEIELDDCSISSAGSAPAGVFAIAGSANTGAVVVRVVGGDYSHAGATPLVANATTNSTFDVSFASAKLGSGYSMLATQTITNKASARVWVHDCANGDTHGLFGYADPFGTLTSDTGIYLTAGYAAQSWKIVTTANCSFYSPFVSPWMSKYHTGTSAITPAIEILRDGSATAYQDDEIWAQFMAKVTAGSTQATAYTDRMALLGTPANQAAGAGTGSWTGEGGTAWSGKIDSGSALTPAEAGHIMARIVVGEPSITVYADPDFTVA